MSYFICTTAKYKKADIAGIERENERLGSYAHEDKHIDRDRTLLNYHVIEPVDAYEHVIDARIESLDLKKAVRKDAVYMCSIVITASDSFFDSMSEYEERDFFTDCAESLAERFGRENVVSAVVHKDEPRPHLHFNFIPVTDGRLSAKDVMSGDTFDNFLRQIYEDTGKKWGLQIGDLSSGIAKTSAPRYKRRQEVEGAVSLAKKIDDRTQEQIDECCRQEQNLIKMRVEESRIKDTVSNLAEERDGLRKDVEKLGRYKANLETAATSPVPLRGRKEEIKALRVRNASLENELADETSENEFLRMMYAKLQDKLNEYSALAAMSEDVMKKFPKEFTDLLDKTRGKAPDEVKDRTPGHQASNIE